MKKIRGIFFAQIIVVTLAGPLISSLACKADTPIMTTANPESAKSQDYVLRVPDYILTSPEEMPQKTDALIAQHEEIERNLLKQYKDPKLSDAAKSEIIFLLGDLRDYGATDVLINDIAFVDRRYPSNFAYQIRGGLVAQKALAAIGRFAFIEIMEVMSNHKKEVPFVTANTEAYAWVLWAIEGKSCSLIKLQARLASEHDPKVRSQYLAVIDELRYFHNEE